METANWLVATFLERMKQRLHVHDDSALQCKVFTGRELGGV